MSLPETPIRPSSTRPPMPPFARGLMRLTGLIALLLFLTPTVFVVKYFAFDHPREEHRAALVSTRLLIPTVTVDTIAPPLAPKATGNAAEFYTAAVQSYADRFAASTTGRLPFPTPDEVGALFEGARRTDSHFFAADSNGRPEFVFHDPDSGGAACPYRFPLSAQERYRYLGAAGALAKAVADAAQTAPAGDRHLVLVGQTLVRFGDALGRERATRTHLQVSYAVQRTGLQILAPLGGRPLQRYVDSLEIYEETIQAKYALLEPVDAENIGLQERLALHDQDPMWRREAVWALGATISTPGFGWRRPLEALTGKATLGQIATQDADASVRAAASDTLGQIARHGAVIRR